MINNLAEKIDNFKKQFEKEADTSSLELMSLAASDLATTKIVEDSLKTGDKAVNFTLNSHTGEKISLTNLLSNGKVVLSFYRGSWCPYCNLELASLQQVLSEIEGTGAILIAVSPELPDYASLVHNEKELGFNILFDKGNRIAQLFGLEFTLDERLRPLYEKFGLDIPSHNGDDTFKLPIPATYVINQDSSIAFHFVDTDYHKRLEPKEILKHL